ncbi:uncharacterized protein BJ212DRAFT_1304926 [Suillus subaureus]|uniref:Uncharacterized protein n=1 Tax=Suillus subaureus TaxID=48587 RepID=A0A9P7J450_9AGAM|nr:uncharacterized protein BJ212DRAFT_1304926 [Suillus subaureus]KAG1801930.1 hypothetical protein BJ212DRAFT_1304926 [Suillus subaureus]
MTQTQSSSRSVLCLLLHLQMQHLKSCARSLLLGPQDLAETIARLVCKEHWLTGVLMEDGVRAKLFKFIPEEEHELVLKVSLFGKLSLAPTGMIAAAVVAIFLLSGNAELTEIGDTMKIPYCEYHNFYHQHLLTGGAWAHQVITFFNDALFSGTSSYVPPSTALNDDGLGHTWEEDFDCAIEDELEELVVDDSTPPILPWHANDNTNSGSVQVNELLLVSHHTSAPSIPAPSILAPPQAVAAPPVAAPPVINMA